MKINNISGIMQSYNVANREVNKGNKSNKPLGEDKFEISQRAKEIAIAKKALMDNPEVRTEKVQMIKEQVEQGTYYIDPVKIAQKMLSKN